jgi:hypothetical protein
VHRAVAAAGTPAALAAAAALGADTLAARADHVHRGFGVAAPLGVGSTAAAVGAALLAAREDHRHALDDTGWIAPALLNGWVNYGAPWAVAGYRRIGNIVLLKGLIRSGTLAQPGFIVPAGFRVAAANDDRHIITVSNDLLGIVRVYGDGRVQIGGPGSNAWYSLEGVLWVADS